MTDKPSAETVGGLLLPHARRIEDNLARWLVEPDTPAALADAMRYSVLGGGKRLRPALVHMVHQAAGGRADDELHRRGAVAVELVHCYSLVHDDLPAMDNDTLRRGLPTVHVKFGEAMAVLVGDALLTRAFGVLAECASQRAAQVAGELARAAGGAGMIAGQVADMGLCPVPDGLEGLHVIHVNKTAALIRAAARIGAICAGADERALAAAGEYGESLGLAFQLFDDLLDVTGDAASMGKTPGKDAAAGKRTHVAAVGLQKARELGEQLTRAAAEAIETLGPRAADLRKLAELLAKRKS